MRSNVEAAALQGEMCRIRSAMDGDVRGVVDNARTLVERAREITDWRRSFREHPWMFAALAVSAGFLLVPRRPRIVQADPQELAGLVRSGKLAVRVEGPAGARPVIAAGHFGPILNMAAGLLLQRGMSLLESQVRRMCFASPDSQASFGREETQRHDQPHS